MQEVAHRAPAVLLRLDGDARAGWDRMLTAGHNGATLVVAARDDEQLDEMLAGLQEDLAAPRVRAAGHPLLSGVICQVVSASSATELHWCMQIVGTCRAMVGPLSTAPDGHYAFGKPAPCAHC